MNNNERYTVVEDRTIVDKTIEQLSIAGILRRIKIGSKEGDVAVLLEEDFIHLVWTPPLFFFLAPNSLL